MVNPIILTIDPFVLGVIAGFFLSWMLLFLLVKFANGRRRAKEEK